MACLELLTQNIALPVNKVLKFTLSTSYIYKHTFAFNVKRIWGRGKRSRICKGTWHDGLKA